MQEDVGLVDVVDETLEKIEHLLRVTALEVVQLMGEDSKKGLGELYVFLDGDHLADLGLDWLFCFRGAILCLGLWRVRRRRWWLSLLLGRDQRLELLVQYSHKYGEKSFVEKVFAFCFAVSIDEPNVDLRRVRCLEENTLQSGEHFIILINTGLLLADIPITTAVFSVICLQVGKVHKSVEQFEILVYVEGQPTLLEQLDQGISIFGIFYGLVDEVLLLADTKVLVVVGTYLKLLVLQGFEWSKL
jgi:hypothetical protein